VWEERTVVDPGTWAPVDDWVPVLNSPGFWGWWYLWVLDSSDDDEAWRVRREVFGADFADYDLDPLFGPYDLLDDDAEEFEPVGSTLELPFPAGYTWRIRFDPGYPGAYHHLLHPDLPEPLLVCSMEPMDPIEVLRWSEVRRIVVDLADWWHRPSMPVPGKYVPLLFLPLAGLSPAEAGEARQVFHDAWTRAGVLGPAQVDTLADWYAQYASPAAEWVDDPHDGFYRSGRGGERNTPGAVSRALTRLAGQPM
jgi:hypothetical protein